LRKIIIAFSSIKNHALGMEWQTIPKAWFFNKSNNKLATY